MADDQRAISSKKFRNLENLQKIFYSKDRLGDK